MANLVGVDSVDQPPRTTRMIVGTLVRDSTDEPLPILLAPVGEVFVGCLMRVEAGEDRMPGGIQAISWAAKLVP